LSSALFTADPRFLEFAPDGRRAFMDALGTLRDQVPAEALTTIEEAAERWADACHAVGVRLGVASEDLRRGVLRD
ncbi:MAG: hypothetical protein M3R02_23550, partial [Chloroflexota bacterium]|nr:hypothetical protein [Chloroflexota bacterium]